MVGSTDTYRLRTNYGMFFETLNLSPGQALFHEGEPSDRMYVIEQGLVAVLKQVNTPDELILNYRHAGQLVGEVSLVGERVRTASVIAVEPSVLMSIKADPFWKLMDENADFRRTVMQTLIDHLLEADASRIAYAGNERELSERMHALADEKEQLAQVLQLRQDTMRFIVHDLRNPLSLIHMALATMEEDFKTDQLSDTGRLITMSLAASQRMLGMVEALLDVERLETGDSALNREEVDLKEMIVSIVEGHQPFTHLKNVTLAADLADSKLPALSIDRVRIERVLSNLIDNALKFTREEGHITVWAGDQGDDILITVTDDGPGIPEDRREHIFDRFIQVGDEARQRRGFGLGLAYCRSAVNAHGGNIWAEAGPHGTGTQVAFTLPLK